MKEMKDQVRMVLEALLNDRIRIDSMEVSNPLTKSTGPDGNVIRDTSEIYITIRAFKQRTPHDQPNEVF